MDRTPLPQVSLYLQESEGKGRGVFAGEFIAISTLVAVCPVLLFPEDSERKQVSCEREVLNSYTYTWDKRTQALSLGLGSMFNHARHNNVGFVLDKPNHLIRYYATTDVLPDQELCINYGPFLWFDDSEGLADSSSDDEEGEFLGRIEL